MVSMNDAKNLAPPNTEADIEERVTRLEQQIEGILKVVQLQHDHIGRIITLLEQTNGNGNHNKF